MDLFNDLRQRGVYSGYERFVCELEPVLQAMSARGLPVAHTDWEEVRSKLEERRVEIEKAMQCLIPEECRPFSPKLGYMEEPKGAVEGGATTHAGEATTWGKRWFLIDRDLDLENNIAQEERWVKLLPWTPSPKNLLAYMRYMKHPIPAHFKTGKSTTGQIELQRLAKQTKDLLYSVVLEYREVSTVIDNHVKNWEPREDGRVHPTFYVETGTGQLASRRPNVQNAPKHKRETADLFRGMVRAKPGHILIEADYKSFHVHTLAFEAQDPDLLRLARLDVHSFVTAHLLKLPDASVCLSWDDEKLGAYLAKIKAAHKDVRDAKVKHAFLGYDNGMGWKKLYNQYQEFFDSQSEAKRVMSLLDALFPRAKAYRERICQVAHEQGYLLSRYGCIRWFWEVFKWEGGKFVSGGDDHEAALSFFTQNDAHCFLKDTILRLHDQGYTEKFGLINTIHDSIMFECSDTYRDECIQEVKLEMERPSTVLIDPMVAPSGLSVGVTVNVGKSWNKMEESR